MATIKAAVNLTTFSAFRPATKDTPIEILFGSSSAVKNKSGITELIADNIPLRSKLIPPSNGLLMLYGHKDTSDELQKRRNEALAVGASFKFADVTVDVGDIFPGILDANDIKTVRFANFRRLSADLQQHVLDEFGAYARESGDMLQTDGNRLLQIATRPDLFSRLIEEDKLFKKIQVLVIPVLENGTLRQLAYARSNVSVAKISQNTDSEIIAMPKWFGKKK